MSAIVPAPANGGLPPLVALDNVEVIYEGIILALRGVSLEIAAGTCTAVLGANGAGKSTLLKAISGVLQAERGEVTRGSIRMSGHRVEGESALRMFRRGVVHVMENRRVLQHMSVEQNLVVGAHLIPGREARADIDALYEQMPILGRLRKQSAGHLSGGEQQLLVLGRALLARPRVLLIDEPSLGLAPIIVAQVYDVLRGVVADGLTVVVVEQNAAAALSIAHQGCVLESGRIVLAGDRAALLANPDIKEFYLGFDQSGTRTSFRDVKHYRRRRRWIA